MSLQISFLFPKLTKEEQKMLMEKDQSPRGMSPDVVSAILDEVAPLSVRGISLGTMVEEMGCVEERIAIYENLSISRSTDNCLPLKPDRERSAWIIFKRQTCPPNPVGAIRN